MKPYGREKKVRFPSKKDVHPPKGFINWREDICGYLSRTTIKQNWKKDIEHEADSDK